MRKKFLVIILITILAIINLTLADPGEGENQTCSFPPVVKIEREVSVKD